MLSLVQCLDHTGTVTVEPALHLLHMIAIMTTMVDGLVDLAIGLSMDITSQANQERDITVPEKMMMMMTKSKLQP